MLIRQFVEQRFGQGEYGCLRSVVRAHSRHVQKARDRRRIDDVTLVLGSEVGQERLEPVDDTKEVDTKESRKEEARDRVVEVLDSIEQDYDPVWGSLLKQVIRRVYPGFSEDYYGYGSFSELLEDAADNDLIDLEFDHERRNYQVSLVKD